MSEKMYSVLTHIMLGIVMLLIIYPLYYVVIASFSEPFDVFGGKTFLWVSQPTIEGYKRIFREPSILNGYKNTLVYTTVGTLFSTILVMITAYPLSRRFPGKKAVMVFFVITMYFTGGLIPTYLVVQKAGLINNMWALFLPGGVSVFNVIIVRNYFERSISEELYEAASIDGADELTIFFRIALPLAKPIVSVMVIFAMVAYWNDWFTALIYLPDKSKEPLQLVLRQILIKSQTAGSMMSGLEGGYAEAQRVTELIKFSSIIVSTVPMLIIYQFVQKHFEKGLMAGAVKG